MTADGYGWDGFRAGGGGGGGCFGVQLFIYTQIANKITANKKSNIMLKLTKPIKISAVQISFRLFR